VAITPNSVESSTRWQIIEAFTSALRSISRAAGYNTSPYVTRDRRKARAASEHFVLLVEEGAESPTDRRNHELEIIVEGAIEPHDRDPVQARNMLLQDVRTAVMGDLNALAGQMGTGAQITLNRCESDAGVFLDDGWTGFEQTFIVKYPQGSTW